MAILPEKDNPPSKSFECSILKKDGTWWVAKVKPRQEKAFALDLLEQGMDYYLPFYEKKTKRSDGKFRKSTLVLFPSYVPFISEDPYALLKRSRIATILPVRLQTQFKKQLLQVYLANESGVKIAPQYSVQYKTGELVKIVNGPLRGIVGRILRIGNGASIVIEVEGMGSAVISVEYCSMEFFEPLQR